jgi:HD-GYP domain-containing protein (c-di-GMP phosphodiesterase class II)
MATVPSLERLAPIVRHHHERYDGTGYDTGLSGESIPMGSRILAVVDAYVSMTSPRAYRAALTWQDALNELEDRSGTQFDPAVVRAFQEVVRERPDLALRVVTDEPV